MSVVELRSEMSDVCARKPTGKSTAIHQEDHTMARTSNISRKPSGNARHEPVGQQNVVSQRRPTDEEIARRAYEIYLARGREDGHDVEDWIQAEQELSLGRH